jgi:hypothetical protein
MVGEADTPPPPPHRPGSSSSASSQLFRPMTAESSKSETAGIGLGADMTEAARDALGASGSAERPIGLGQLPLDSDSSSEYGDEDWSEDSQEEEEGDSDADNDDDGEVEMMAAEAGILTPRTRARLLGEDPSVSTGSSDSGGDGDIAADAPSAASSWRLPAQLASSGGAAYADQPENEEPADTSTEPHSATPTWRLSAQLASQEDGEQAVDRNSCVHNNLYDSLHPLSAMQAERPARGRGGEGVSKGDRPAPWPTGL